MYSFNFSDQSLTWGTGPQRRGIAPQQRGNGPPEKEAVLHCCSLSISVRTRGQLMATSITQDPGHNFVSEDPTIFLEDANITTGERVARPRQYPKVLLPSAPTLGAEQVSNFNMQDIQRLHQKYWQGLANNSLNHLHSVIQCSLHLFPLLSWTSLPLKLALKNVQFA